MQQVPLHMEHIPPHFIIHILIPNQKERVCTIYNDITVPEYAYSNISELVKLIFVSNLLL